MRHFQDGGSKAYVPDMGIQYPDNPFQRMLKVEVENSEDGKYRFDETFPYLDNSFNYKINNILGFIFQWTIAVCWNRLHYGLRISGQRKLHVFRQSLKNGAMCICNHVYQFDALSVNQAVCPFRKMRIPMYAKHFNGSKRWFMRYVGGVPIPETTSGFRKFNEAFDEFHRRRNWMLVFPESVRWDWYRPIRPFFKGGFSMAYKYGIPIIPVVITYRKRRGVYRLFGKKELPCVNIQVGEPLFVDKSLPKAAETERLLKLTHQCMVRMAGIVDNPWPAQAEAVV